MKSEGGGEVGYARLGGRCVKESRKRVMREARCGKRGGQEHEDGCVVGVRWCAGEVRTSEWGKRLKSGEDMKEWRWETRSPGARRVAFEGRR